MAKDDVRRNLLNAAGETFAELGYRRATVRQICRKAGANVAAVNYYFGDKQRLYIEAVKHARRMRAERQPLPQWSESTPPAEKLRMVIHTLLRRMLGEDGDPWQARLVVREIIEPTRACEEMVQEAFRPMFERILGIVREMVPSDTPVHRAEQIVFSIISQCVYYRVHGALLAMLVSQRELREHYRLEQVAEHICQFSLAALGHGCMPGRPAARGVECHDKLVEDRT